MSDAPTIDDIKSANALARAGDRAGARERLEDLFRRGEGDPVIQCVIAHHLADAQDDPHAELAWDVRALEASQRWTPEAMARHAETPPLAIFMPSLLVNLAEDYLKTGDPARSRAYLEEGREAVTALPDDAYGQLIRDGIARLQRKLDALA